MSSGATFDWTFPQAFAGNTASDADETSVETRGVLTTDADPQRTDAAVSMQGTTSTEVRHE